MRELAPEVAVAAPRRRRPPVRASSALATWGLIRFDNPLIWIPLAFVQGFTVFNFTVLLHEVVHHTVFERRHPRRRAAPRRSSTPSRAASRRASSPAGISTITRSSARTRTIRSAHHLSPKVNARWYKLLYCTPALFPIYFRAARREVVDLSAARCSDASRASASCRCWFHLSALALLWYVFGFYAALRSEHHSGLLHLPDRVHAQPPRPALRHRPDRSGEVGHADARALVLGLRVT